jgi:hypothetical protein
LWHALIRTLAALLCGGIAYTGWLALFLLTANLKSAWLQTAWWVLAPLETAIGFTSGIALSERLTAARKSRFFHILVWPLVGCVFGAGAVYWLGPMLIVFGMFAAGAAGTILREVSLYVAAHRQERRNE